LDVSVTSYAETETGASNSATSSHVFFAKDFMLEL